MALNNCTKDPTLEYEYELLLKYRQVIGIDEVGRGALAGPVAVGAQIFTAAHPEPPTGLRDSKLLSEKRRQALYPEVLAWGAGAVGLTAASEIDSRGITQALADAGAQALLALRDQGIDLQKSVVLLDGKHNWLAAVLHNHAELAHLEVVTRVGADRACAVVSAASIRAKVTRDKLLQEAATEYPGYSWESNKGYGSKSHQEAIAKLGITPFHRASWIKSPSATLF